MSTTAVITENHEYVKLWTIQTQQWVKLQSLHRIPINGIEFSPDGSRLVTYGHISLSASYPYDVYPRVSYLYGVWFWDAQGRLLAGPEETNIPFDDPFRASLGFAQIYTATFSPDGSMFVVHDYILDASGQTVGGLDRSDLYKNLPITSYLLEFSSDSSKLISMNYSSPVGYVWNRQGHLLLKLFSYRKNSTSGHILAATFSPDSSRLVTNATLQEGDPLKLWDSQGDQLVLVANLEGHQGKVPTMTFSPNSRLLATIDDHAIRLWNRQGRLLNTFPNKQDEREFTLKLRFSPDGSRLISHGIKRKKSSQTFTLNVWDVSDL